MSEPVSVVRFCPGEENDTRWDGVVAESLNGTFLHTRRYLGYHGRRFQDASLVVQDRAGAWLGVLPAAVDSQDPTVLSSHPGITYGGIVHTGALAGERMLEALSLVARHAAEAGFAALVYKPVPPIYHRRPSQDDLYALFRVDAERFRVDLCATIDLREPRTLSRERRGALRRAVRAGVAVERDAAALQELWPLLEWQLETRHHTRPVHSLAEMEDLVGRFGERIQVWVGRVAGEAVAGVITFVTDRVVRAQYSIAGPASREEGALTLVFEEAIRDGAQSGRRYIDFGNSNEADGRILNTGLFRFKAGFGASATVQEFYRIGLSETYERGSEEPTAPA